MSVLSRPQGVPERVWSLVGGLSALGGQSDRDSLDRLLNPGFMKDGLAIRTKPELAGDALGAASSLGFISASRTDATQSQKVDARTSAEFADIVHDHLLSLDATQTDRVLLEAYAWLAAESDRQGDLAWIYEWSRDEFADGANRGLVGEDEDGKPMNSTKAVAWRRWMAFLGLGVAMPIANMPDFPSPASRIAREIERASLERGQDFAADAFLSLIVQRMPYLDGGALYRQACDRIGHQPRPRRLSPLLSAALRDLHDEGAIRLIPRGDASNAVRLSDDPAHPIQTFTLVQIGAGPGASA